MMLGQITIMCMKSGQGETLRAGPGLRRTEPKNRIGRSGIHNKKYCIFTMIFTAIDAARASGFKNGQVGVDGRFE